MYFKHSSGLARFSAPVSRRHFSSALVLGAGALVTGLPAMTWAATVGQNAPDFSAVDTAGKTRRLSEFRGKLVVLEWTRLPLCTKTLQRHWQWQWQWQWQ